MLMRRLSASLADDRSLQWLPLILAAVALGAMQARLLPVRPIALDIPSTFGVPPGAALEESIAPPSPAPVAAPSMILPNESQAPAVSLPSGELGSGAAVPGAQRLSPEAAGGAEAWADHLPRFAGIAEGSGNLVIHNKQPTAVSTLVASMVKSLSRLRPSGVLTAKALAERIAALKPPLKHTAQPLLPTRAPPPRAGLAGWAVGGAAPQHDILGGPALFASRYAPVINGATAGRYR
jgi:hypothetical protein